MSSSEWGSWCRACRKKRSVMRGAPRYDWWMARREELVSDRLAFKPKYGPEPCFDCAGPYETGQFIYCPSVHDELRGDEAIATVRGGGVAQKICSECWYADHEEPPTNRQDEQTSCDICGKELVQVIVVADAFTSSPDDEDEEEEPVELMVDLRRHVCTQEYATTYVEVPAAWADDPAYWDDEILEAALGQGYGPDWEMDTETHSDEPAEIVEVEVV